jgi:rhamnose transport system permease protein
MSRLKLSAFQYWHEVVLFALLVGLMLTAGYIAPKFTGLSAQSDMSTHVWELALLALPMTFIIITAGIDLSIGSTMALCAVVFGMGFEAGISLWICAGLALLTGTCAGALNGVFVGYLRVHPLIVTLATMAVYRGVAEGVSHARPISGFPDSFAVIGRGTVLGLPIPGLFFIVALVVAIVALSKTPFGRSVYAIGHNENTSRFSGISVDKIKLLLYTLSGTAAAMAAIMFVARRNTAKADIGQGMELDVITAVVLGGTSIYGGKGRIAGTLLGILLIHETREFVSWQWSKDEYNAIVVGVLLIVSVLLNTVLVKRGKG